MNEQPIIKCMDMLKNGEHVSKISKDLGLSEMCVRSVSVGMGLTARGRPKNSFLIKNFKELYESGATTEQLQERFGLKSPSMVSYYISVSKLPPRSPGRRPGETGKTIEIRTMARKMKADGMTYAKIGKHFGVTRQRIQQIITTHEAVKNGKCENCGRECKSLHRHHTDYMKDKISNLCCACHTRSHKKTKS